MWGAIVTVGEAFGAAVAATLVAAGLALLALVLSQGGLLL